MTHYDRLDAAIGSARLDRGLSWIDLADAVGVSESALRNIRKGRNSPSELTKRRLEDALQWRHGSVDEVLAGGDPTPANPTGGSGGIPSDDELAAVEALLEQAMAELNRLKQRRTG